MNFIDTSGRLALTGFDVLTGFWPKYDPEMKVNFKP
jgi:hypothetical protein